MSHYNSEQPWYKKWESFFPGDAVNHKTGVREKISEFFILTVGAASQVVGSTKNMNEAQNSARQMRDEMGMDNVRVKRITRIGSVVERN